jgi:hypothetical protein
MFPGVESTGMGHLSIEKRVGKGQKEIEKEERVKRAKG